MERALCCVRFQFLCTPQKYRFDWACVLCLPSSGSSGSQELDGRTLPVCDVPSPLHGPSLSFCPRQSGVCALCLAETVPADVDHPESQEVSVWRPVCSFVGVPSLGPSLALSPPPCLLPPAGMGQSAAS
ncbi:unnamed protein product [Rangifer tarandus platyrhynchus]|uniref:Uncharacterized protein n=1 Tax=Rangifer tarandus platyrhynchus TaxID=3082113 RepID=A0AC59Y6A4_RANTA